MQRAIGHYWHIRLFHILGADVVQDLAVNLHVAVSAIIVVTGRGMYAPSADHRKRNDHKRAEKQRNLELFRH